VNAVIMAGGEGSRLRPLTNNMPKPMLPVVNRPLMEHIIVLLKKHGFVDVCATVQFLSSVIRNYFADGSDLGVSLSYSTEEMPLGTAGSVLNARDLVSGTFLVISGDSLTDLDLKKVVDWHQQRGAAATLVLKHMTDPLEFGIVMTGEDGRIERFLEKPSWGQVFTDTINTGIYVLEPEVLDLIPPDQPYDFSSELFPLMLDKGLPLFGYVADEYWTDVGTTDSYIHSQLDALAGKVSVDLPGFEYRPGVWVGGGAEIHSSARIEGPAVIGDNARVGAGAVIGPYAVVGANALIGADARVTGGVVMDRAHVGPLAQVRGGVLGREASLDRSASVEEGAVLGDSVVVGAGALIKPRVKVYPGRTVEAGAIVTQSVVQERRATRSLFGSRGLAGLMNVGVTPMVAVRVGMAYGSTLKRGNVVVTGRDASRAARTMKRAVIAGLNSTGVDCRDLELMPMPLTRFIVRSQQAAGGVSVRTSPGDPESIEIRLFDADGGDLSENDQRKIERIFYREDYRRTGAMKLGELEFPPHAPEQYVAGILRTLEIDTIRSAELKVVVDYAFGPLSLVGPSIMGRLGCDMLAVNAYVDENRPALATADIEQMLGDLQEHVVNSGSDLGVLIEPGGEIVHLVDDTGSLVSDDRLLLAFIVHESTRGARQIAVPVSAPKVVEEIAAEHGASVTRTPTSLTTLMGIAREPEVGFAGNSEGTLIFPGFMPAPDGLMTFAKALELVATTGGALSKCVDTLPEIHVARRDVQTPWNLKGAVMRRLSSMPVNGRLVLLDGVKVIEEDRWVLVIPLADEPLCRIWAEGRTDEEANELADHYAKIVEGIAEEGLGTG
jgi:mannose-1-phosphate guanylyltransferase / phosphomannomutase